MEVQERMKEIVITEDDVSDAACFGYVNIESDVLNEVLPENSEGAVADVNISYTVKEPLHLKEKNIRKGNDLYQMVPDADHPLRCKLYKNGHFVKGMPVTVDWEVTSENVDTNPVYRDVWAGRTIYGPDEPAGEELAYYEYVGNVDVRILGVEMPDLDLS